MIWLALLATLTLIGWIIDDLAKRREIIYWKHKATYWHRRWSELIEEFPDTPSLDVEKH